MKELGDDIQADEKESIEKAIEELKSVLEGDDKEAIEAKTEALTEASSSMAERVYAKKGGDAGAAEQEAPEQASSDTDEDVVDAEFEEVQQEKDKE